MCCSGVLRVVQIILAFRLFQIILTHENLKKIMLSLGLFVVPEIKIKIQRARQIQVQGRRSVQIQGYGQIQIQRKRQKQIQGKGQIYI